MNSHCRLHPASEGVVEGDDFVGDSRTEGIYSARRTALSDFTIM